MKHAMILAAGRGERLRPLTDLTPKPMLPVQGIPLIEHHVRRLAQAGIQHLVINHAWLGGQIRRHLKDGSRWGIHISYSPEPPGGLETGGGLHQALRLLGDAPFLAVNADIITDYPFQSMILPENNLAHLVLVPTSRNNPQGDFSLTATGHVSNAPQHVYSGIAVYHPDFFKDCGIGRYSITPTLRAHCREHRVTGELYEGQWQDIGIVLT